MKRKLKVGDIVEGTFGKMRVVEDFLPSPDQLIFKKEPKTVKVTLTLDTHSTDFFKKEAKRLGRSYQRMMRNLLTEYAERALRSRR